MSGAGRGFSQYFTKAHIWPLAFVGIITPCIILIISRIINKSNNKSNNKQIENKAVDKFSLPYVLSDICSFGNNSYGLSESDSYSADGSMEVTSSCTLAGVIMKVKSAHEAHCSFFRNRVTSDNGKIGFEQMGSFLSVSWGYEKEKEKETDAWNRCGGWMMYDITYRFEDHPKYVEASQDLKKSLNELGIKQGMMIKMTCHSR